MLRFKSPISRVPLVSPFPRLPLVSLICLPWQTSQQETSRAPLGSHVSPRQNHVPSCAVAKANPSPINLCPKANKLLKTWLLLALLSLAACANDGARIAAHYQRYVAAFDRQQPHLSHALRRPDGYAIRAREFGVAHAGKGPSLILMHGFPDNQHLYDLLIPLLAQTHHVISFDFLGWGDSDKPAAHLYNVASQREDLDTVIAQLGLEDVVIVVHDLSGQAGIDWALDNQAKTAALVLLNTYYVNMPTLLAPEAIAFYAKPGWRRDLAVWGATKSASRFQHGVASQIGKFLLNDRVREQFVPVLVHSAPGIRPAFFSSTAVLWQEIAARERNITRMRHFKQPVHVLFGTQDPYLNTGVAAQFHQLFPSSTYQPIANAGHYVQLDQPVVLAQLLLEHLAAGRESIPLNATKQFQPRN
jgi:haloalkane dehalogenase